MNIIKNSAIFCMQHNIQFQVCASQVVKYIILYICSVTLSFGWEVMMQICIYYTCSITSVLQLHTFQVVKIYYYLHHFQYEIFFQARGHGTDVQLICSPPTLKGITVAPIFISQQGFCSLK